MFFPSIFMGFLRPEDVSAEGSSWLWGESATGPDGVSEGLSSVGEDGVLTQGDWGGRGTVSAFWTGSSGPVRGASLTGGSGKEAPARGNGLGLGRSSIEAPEESDGASRVCIC